MKFIEHHCQGESHKSSDKPCQDYAYAESSNGLSIAIVCDGHGGERYFRSQYGSQFATEITKEAIHAYVENMASSFENKEQKSVFDGSSFTSYNAMNATDSQLDSEAHKSLMWLFSSIISQWNLRITQHAMQTDLTEWELSHVEQKYQDEFLNKRKSEDSTFEKTYGCTLMAYVQTPTYWFAFHLGDGKCVSMRVENEKLVCEQPIPWDERCFLNKTTSLCDSNALEEFRYCYQGNGEFPLAMFLGSDGMDDSYGDGFNLYNFYIQLFKLIIRNGKERTYKELVKTLPIISEKGSKDDMSVASVYDDRNLTETFFLLTGYQKMKLNEQIDAIESKILELQNKIDTAGNYESLDRSQQINIDYAIKDLSKAKDKASKLDYKIRYIKGEETKYRNRLKEIDPVIPPIESDSSMRLINVDDSTDN